MRPDDVREHLDRRPFQPFRVYLSSGEFFDVRQAELAYLGRSTLNLALPIDGDRQRFAVVALIHIVWLEVSLPVIEE